MEPTVRLEGVSKVFLADEVETHALTNINLIIERGDYVAIGGPSGCGKTTLLSILGLLDEATSGRYYLDGALASNLSFSERARIRNHSIGFVFQAFNLIGDLSVYDNVALPLTYRGLSAKERHGAVLEVLERVDMSHRVNHYPSQLSGGQQQRVSVARALVGKPAVIFADEPTGNLDSKNAEQIMHLLGTINEEGSTLCMVTHDPRFAKYARRTVSLFDGAIVDQAAALTAARA